MKYAVSVKTIRSIYFEMSVDDATSMQQIASQIELGIRVNESTGTIESSDLVIRKLP